MVSICMSLMTGDVEHLSVWLLAVRVSSLEKCTMPSEISQMEKIIIII